MKTKDLAKQIVENAFTPDLAYNDRVNRVAYYLERYAGDLEFSPKHLPNCVCIYCETDKLISKIEVLNAEIRKLSSGK